MMGTRKITTLNARSHSRCAIRMGLNDAILWSPNLDSTCCETLQTLRECLPIG